MRDKKRIISWWSVGILARILPTRRRAILFWRFAKVVTQQNANRNRRAITVCGEKVQLSYSVYDRLVQAVTGPARNFDATDFALRVNVDQHVNGGFNLSVSRAFRIGRF